MKGDPFRVDYSVQRCEVGRPGFPGLVGFLEVEVFGPLSSLLFTPYLYRFYWSSGLREEYGGPVLYGDLISVSSIFCVRPYLMLMRYRSLKLGV